MRKAQPKPKACKVCRSEFVPSRPMQRVCCADCALSLAASKRAKEQKRAQAQERRADKAKREKLKTLSQLANEAQQQVNRYVRARDQFDGCISCDKPATWNGQWHASHFRSRGAAAQLRFHLWNIHKACSICNNHLSGNISGYTDGLIKKIGSKKVAWLLSENSYKKYNADYLNRLKRIFAKKAKRQEKRNEMLR